MKRKYGFTLVELLAIIVVLAILSLITVPLVLGIIDKAKEASFEDSVKISSRQIEMYLFENGLSEIPDDGIKVKNLNINSDFISGTFKDEDGKIVADKVRNKEFCASGPINKLVIRKDCDELDTTEPVINENSLVLSKTSNSITVNILNGFATEEESYIKNYTINIYDNNQKIDSKTIDDVGTVKFTNLTSNKEYKIEVIATNSNNLTATTTKTITTTEIGTPTYAVSPSGWAQSKTVTISYPNGYTNEYSTDGGITWEKYTSALLFSNNGSVIARVTDGVNTTSAAAQTITEIDTSAPTSATFAYTSTSNSIIVTASGTDDEAGIKYYQFSKDGGTTWTDVQTSNKYTFSNLTTGKYNIKVKVINSTYANVKTTNANNSLESETKEIETISIIAPTYSVTPSGWAQSKTVTITYQNGYTNEYSLDSGLTWNTYSKPLTFNANGTVIARITDGTNKVTASAQTVTEIDNDAPTTSTFTYTKTSNSIKVTASGTDKTSKIVKYQFSKDNGSTWTSLQDSNVYEFKGLSTGKYNVKVKVYDQANNSLESASQSIETVSITTPTYTVSPSGWAQSKTVTITYASGYTNEYSIDGGKTWNTYSKAITLTANGSVIARSSDGTNTVTASSQSVTQIDTTAPTTSTFTYTKTSNSIVVTASGTDSESGITHYQFSKDNGSTWTAIQTSNKYTFSNLTTGTYNIMVKVINGTYANVKAVNVNNSFDSASQAIATTAITAPTYTVSPSGWAQSKTVSIAYPSGYTNQYSTDGGKTWNTYSKALTFTANGSVIARSSDGTNTVTAASQSITQIDTTKPTAASFTTTNTSNSITVTATGSDSESGITHYQFSKDNGTSWTAIQTSNKYTFSNLTTGTYNIKVKVINGTYANVKAVNANNSLDSSAKEVATTSITTPTYTVSPSGWAQSKTVSITYASGYTNEYSLDGGSTWNTYSKALTFTANGSVIARISDGTNIVKGSSQSVTQIDTTKPTAASFTYTKTSNSITINATGTDGESGITHYQFSKDNGSTWTAIQTSNVYTFSNLTTGTYNIKVKVINGTYANVKAVNANNSLDSSAQSIATTAITAPTYAVSPSGWAQSKTVTITYASGYTNEYSTDSGKTWNAYSKAITFTANGSVIARSSDGTNTVTASSQSVTQIDTTKPTAASFTATKTSNSITVTASGTDSESGITHYQFSKDNGSTWTTIQTSNKYTFSNLTTGAYNIKVKVINGTYANVKAVNANNSLDSSAQSIATTAITAPTYAVSPSGWAQSKTVTITYASGYTNEYSTDSGKTWNTYSKAITLTANGSVIARSSDGTNTVTASSQSVSQIDTTAPTASTFTYTKTSNSIVVTASGTDSESGITHYQFSKDNGSTWTTIQTSNKYTFSNLTTGSYNIMVKVINGTYANAKEVNINNSLNSASQAIATTEITKPTYAVSPSGWAQSKTVSITYPSGYTNQYSTDGGKTWNVYSKAITFTANGSVIARSSDGTNTVSAASQSVTQIDTTAPTAATFTYTKTSNSITVTASGTDSESGITHYQFSKDNGSTWTTIQTSNKYTFSNLTTGAYDIMVKVINGTYANVKAANSNNSLNSSAQTVATTDITIPTYSVTPSGWAQSKTVTINYVSGYTNEYSLDGGSTWNTYSKALTFTANGTVIARISDGTNYVKGSSQSVSQIDTTAPTTATFTYTKTSNSIVVTAKGTDSESGILYYQFSKDGGSTWTNMQTSNKYTFNGLTTNSYNIKIKVINGTYANVKALNANNSLESSNESVSTDEITKPTYSVTPSGWAQSKIVTITYPSGYTNEYSLDGGKTWNTYSSSLTFTANGSVIARSSDGTNTVTAASQSITQVDTTKPTAASFTTTNTSNSITVTATGSDSESGITHYQFSKDNGTSWTAIQTSNKYTFSNLTTGTYNIKVKVINGTYANVKAVNANNSLDSSAKAVATTAIATPTYAVSPSGWAQSKTVSITYTSGYTNEYSLDGGSTWNTYSKALTFTANGSVIARISDGTNIVKGSSQSITQIDTTKPTAASFTYTRTSNSITVTASGTDSESGITHYQFSKDNGSTWTAIQTSNVYTFSSLTSGTYNIKVKVINGTYANVKAVNTNNSLDSSAQSIATTTITTPTYAVSPSGWAQSKTVTITYASGYTNEYSTDSGKTWNAYSKAITLTANGSVIARSSDGTNTVTASSQSVSQIDTTKPTASSFTSTKTSNSITVTASGTDSESGITHYQFSKDNGSTWTAVQTSNKYTFSNLTTGAYNIKVKVINGTYANVKAVNTNNSLDSSAQSIATTTIGTPTYTVSPSGWAQSKTVTIAYQNGYTNQYSLDGGSTWKTYSSALTFTANGSVIARITDGVNIVTGSSQSITQIDTTKPTAASFTTTNTSNSITVTATGSDSESGITHYQFSKDNGTTWTTIQTSNKYTFSNLTTGTYNIKVKVINGTYANVKAVNANNSLDSSAKAVATTAIATPTYAVSPSGWAQSKTVSITYTSGYTNEYSLDGGSTWNTYSKALTFTANGSVIARISDGTNIVKGSSQSVTQIDTTKPTASSFTYTKTSNSITINATGTDSESGITHYQFSKDNGSTWTTIQTSNVYTFSGLTTGTYNIKVKVINGTYANVKAVNANNSLDSSAQSITTTSITAPTYTVSPSGWAQSKTVTINYVSGYTNEYSLDGGSTWYTYSKALTFTANGSVIARISDGTNVVTGSSQSVTQIDTTKPTSASFSTTNTSNSITITAAGVDNESGVTHYQFSKDNGSTWTTIQTSNKYTFSNLKTGTYNIMVKVVNGTYANVKAVNANNSLNSAAKAVATTAITTPIYAVSPSGWAQSKTVTITYPSGYTNEYSLDGGTTWKTYSSALTLTGNGSVIARVSDGTNVVTGSSQSVSQIDTSAPTAASLTATKTSNSITVTASGTDSESGITHYQFSKDGGSTWTTVQTSNKYTFSNLTTGTYKIMVKVINGTYANVKATNANNSLNSSVTSVTTNTITTPTYAVSPSGWAQSKTVTISYASGYTNEYSLDGGTTWKTYSSALTFTANGSVIARSSDGTNTVKGSSQSVSQIDTSAPTAASFTYTRTSKSITVTATGTDSESGITHYQFSKDGGTTWTTIQTGNSYTFDDLATGTYNIKVKVINGTYANVKAVNANNSLESAVQAVATIEIEAPTYSVTNASTWALSKTVTITYPSGYTNQYSLDGGTTWKTYSGPIVLTDLGSTSATVIARVTDGKNYKTGSSLTVTNIYLTSAENVTFTPSDSSWNVTTVYDALEYLRNN